MESHCLVVNFLILLICMVFSVRIVFEFAVANNTEPVKIVNLQNRISGTELGFYVKKRWH